MKILLIFSTDNGVRMAHTVVGNDDLTEKQAVTMLPKVDKRTDVHHKIATTWPAKIIKDEPRRVISVEIQQ